MNYPLNLTVGWAGFFAGAISGAIIGLYFHRDGWLGGYNAFPRRMVRLGHIAFFGLGLINMLFALSVTTSSVWTDWGSRLLAIGAVTMPLNCFLTAWKKPFRHLFFIPASSTLGGILVVLLQIP